MKREDALSAHSVDQMAAVLDNAPVAVYVSAVDNLELLYYNRLASELFLKTPYRPGLTCYQVAGFDRPCPFCHAEQMSADELLVRKFNHPDSGRVYQLSGKIIDWAGRPAHIEYITDITETVREEERQEAFRQELLTTFQSIPCGLSVYRFEGGRLVPVSHNSAFYEIMGYSGEHVKSVEQETSYLGVHPDDLPLLQKKVAETIQTSGVLRHTYRVWNDEKQSYRWIHLEGSVKSQAGGSKLIYGVYSDVTEQRQMERELSFAGAKMQDIINAIPGGVAIYKVSDTFKTVYFSDGVPELSGYTVEEYRELLKDDAARLIYPGDTAMVIEKIHRAIQEHATADFEFRKLHRDGHIVWVHIQAKQIGEEDGCPLLHCVFHNISAFKETQFELDHLVNSIPGGIASYRVEGDHFIPAFFSDGVMALTGHSRQELEELLHGDALSIVYEADKERVLTALKVALESGNVLDVSYRAYHKNGQMIWIHLNGRRIGPPSGSARFYAVFTGMSSEALLFQNIADETADGIYVIDRNNYDLLYVNESKELFSEKQNCVGQKCYAALHGKSAPCEFCSLNTHAPDGEEHEMLVDGTECYYNTRFRETDWNGIPAYIKYVRDVTEEVRTRKEKERLEQYFQTVVKYLPGGVAVVRHEKDGRMIPEFLSDGFAAMTGMSVEEAWRLYQEDAMSGVHPDDLATVNERMAAYIASGDSQCEITYRLKSGSGGYIWVINTLTMIRSEGGESRVYAGYRDITREREEQEELRRQYNELIMQHYRTPGPNTLIVGHCNITQNEILEIIDHTDSDLLETFGTVRENFFTGISMLAVDEADQQTFREMYLNAPALAAFERGDTEQILTCFIKLPKDRFGRYAQIKVNLVKTPDTGDVTGILTVTDVTEQVISDKILHQLSVTSYDYVVDLNLPGDFYTVLACNQGVHRAPPPSGRHSVRTADMIQSVIVPRDRELYAKSLDVNEIRRRLSREGSYTISYSLIDEDGAIRAKRLRVSAIDLRLGRVCLVCIDVTESVQEQQGLLNVVAHTFEVIAFIRMDNRHLTMYTRQAVLENLPPYQADDYNESIKRLISSYVPEAGFEESERQFRLENMIRRLKETPGGYDFVLPFRTEEGELRYKQINVLWGDRDHKTVCLLRADVTDMLAAERNSKTALEKALALAEEASRAKSDFLSSMSHDIRTPMNAIIGMTALATAHLDERQRVEDCLQKISLSSKHLLSLINDILDMSKIERSKIILNRMWISLPRLMEQLTAIMGPQARDAGLRFTIHSEGVSHKYFYGDSLRVNQILLNILSNAIKFTPEGGEVIFRVEEIPPLQGGRVRYCFTVSDTGIGMSEDFAAHIFEAFSRNRNATHVEGTGLGLSITKGLIDLMGGSISVESQLHEGTTFRVELECDTAEREEELADTVAQEPLSPSGDGSISGRCFLVAEDNAINAEIICELLQMQGVKTVVKTDGIQAVQAFRESEPGTYDAILMDIQMPLMNGYEATRALRGLNRPDAGEIPIIAMTANAFAEDIQASLEAGMNAHVAKPVDMQVLLETLGKLLPEVSGE